MSKWVTVKGIKEHVTKPSKRLNLVSSKFSKICFYLQILMFTFFFSSNRQSRFTKALPPSISKDKEFCANLHKIFVDKTSETIKENFSNVEDQVKLFSKLNQLQTIVNDKNNKMDIFKEFAEMKKKFEEFQVSNLASYFQIINSCNLQNSETSFFFIGNRRSLRGKERQKEEKGWGRRRRRNRKKEERKEEKVRKKRKRGQPKGEEEKSRRPSSKFLFWKIWFFNFFQFLYLFF